MLECVSTSDWHLTDKSNHFNNLLSRQMFEIRKIYQYCIDNGIRHLMCPGDIGDTDTLEESVKLALVDLWEEYDGHVDTHYIPGNHDFNNINKTSMDLFNSLQRKFKSLHIYMKPTTIELDGIKVNMLPFPCLESPKSKIGALNFTHVSYNGAIGDNGRKLRVNNEFIQNPNDFNVSGHIHTYQYLELRNALYNGAPYQKNFGESLPKGHVHLKVRMHKGAVDARHKFIENNPSFRFVNLRIDSRADLKKLNKSDSYRYKLWVAPDVILPSDLKLEYPNITGGIFDLSSKSAKVEELVVAQNTIRNINAKQRLRKYMETAGHDANFVKHAISESRKAASALGISIL